MTRELVTARDQSVYHVGEYLRDLMLGRGWDAVRLAAEMDVPIRQVCRLLHSVEINLFAFEEPLDRVFGDAADVLADVHYRWFDGLDLELTKLWFEKELFGNAT